MSDQDNIFRSKLPDITPTLKAQGSSFHNVFLDSVTKGGDKTAFICGVTGRTLSYAAVLGTTRKFADVFYHKYTVRKGTVVALMVPNTPEYVCMFQGVAALGGVVSPVNSMFSASEVEKQLRLSGAKVMVIASVFQPQVEEGIAALPEADRPLLMVADKCADLKDEALPKVPADYAVDAKPDDVVALPFSSGTTGLPKGVQLTNANLVANLLQVETAIEFDPNDVVMAVLPYFHIYGLTVILHGTLYIQGTQVVMPKFDMVQYLDLVDKHKATILFVAPPIMVGFIKHPKTKEITTSQVRIVISGAAPLGEDIQKMAEPLFPNATIGQGYGLTETSPVITVTPLGTHVYGSAGILASSTEMRVVKVSDEEGEEGGGKHVNVASGEEGELWVRGPQVMKGYLKEEDTKIVFPEPGWFRTGDLVKVDKDGFVFVTDRIKELIKYKGYQVAPAELEALIQTHPFVQETIVIGINDDAEGAGEIPRAWVVLKPTVGEAEKATAAEAIVKFVDERVAPYKKLRGGVKIVDAIPKTASGKLLRRVVRDAENKKD